MGTYISIKSTVNAFRYGIDPIPEWFDKELELLKLCEETGIFIRKGSWYWYGDVRVGNGGDNT